MQTSHASPGAAVNSDDVNNTPVPGLEEAMERALGKGPGGCPWMCKNHIQ